MKERGANRDAIDVTKVLVISLGGAGDTLMATPLLRELRAAFPKARIDVLTMQGAVARDILRGNPNVDQMLHFNFLQEGLWRSLRYCARLRKTSYDLSFTVMPQNRIEYNMVTWFVGARERLGMDYAIRCGALPGWFLTRRVSEDTKAHLVENNLRLLSEGLGQTLSGAPLRLDLFPDQENRRFADSFLARPGLRGRRLIGFHPGSGTTKNLAIRRWGAPSWAALAARLLHDEAWTVLLFGSPEEAGLRREIMESSGAVAGRVLEAPQGSILDTAALMSRLEAFVCCDTLLTHVAAAMGVPSVVIMGPTPHTSVYPLGTKHRIVRTGLACSPCYGYSRHGIRCTHEVPMMCLKGIQPDSVHEALKELLA